MITHSIIGDVYIHEANTFFKRLKGLLGSKTLPDGHAVSLISCRAVHTFGMRYAISLICLDRQGVITDIVESLPPNKYYIAPKQTYQILEFSTNHRINRTLIHQPFFI